LLKKIIGKLTKLLKEIGSHTAIHIMATFNGFHIGADTFVKQIDFSLCQLDCQNFVRHLYPTRASCPLKGEENKTRPAGQISDNKSGHHAVAVLKHFVFSFLPL
jgi:hypothetical protein